MLIAKKYMSNKVITVPSGATVLAAYKLLYENNIRHLPVTDQNGVVIGMLSDRDVQRAMVVDRSNGDEDEEIYLTTAKKVSEFMSPVVFTASPDTTLGSIAEVMMNKKISAVVMVDESLKCVGILTSQDMLRVFLEQIHRSNEIFDKPLNFFMPNTLY